MYEPKTVYTKVAQNAILEYLRKGNTIGMTGAVIPSGLQKKQACFVCLQLLDESLRGCIGTIEPRTKSLYHEIIRNAVLSAISDDRFQPVTIEEMDKIRLSVDVLSLPCKVKGLEDLDPKNKGIIVSDGMHSKGVLLPDVSTIKTPEKQFEIARKKAGLEDIDFPFLQIHTFTSQRYD